jgi:hypothetical protein
MRNSIERHTGRLDELGGETRPGKTTLTIRLER